jgi:hypothetical protein
MAETVIVMPYYDRQYQLNKTLETIALSKYRDFSIVIVDDNSPKDIILPEVDFKIDVIKVTGKNWTNCSPVWNMGFNAALLLKPKTIVLQSPECYHVGDVLTHVKNNLTNKNYLAYGCFQINKETTFSNHNIIKLASECKEMVTHNKNGLGQNAWWNHTIYCPMPQYWCTAITADNLIKVNGIDERFAHGYAIEDGWFIDQIKRAGMRVDIIDYPFVVHQWHDRQYPVGVPQLVKQNKALWEKLRRSSEYRSVHHITPDLKWSGT